jgi:hypothetical protein
VSAHELPSEAAVREILSLLPSSSFIVQFVRWSQDSSDAPLIFALFGALQAIEACAGASQITSFAEDRALNQYTGFIGKSGTTHKSWVIARVKRMIVEAKIAGDNPGIQKSALAQLAQDAIKGRSPVALNPTTDGGSDEDEADAAAEKAEKKKKKRARKHKGKSGYGNKPPPIPPAATRAIQKTEEEKQLDMNPYGFLRKPSTHQAVKWALSTIPVEEDPLRKSLVIYQEGEVFFAQQAAEREFRSFYMDAYDGDNLSDMTKGAQYRVILENARLSLLLGATPEHIKEFMDAQAWLQGLAGRFMWAYGISERRKLEWTSTTQTAARWGGARDALRRIHLTNYEANEDANVPLHAQRLISQWTEEVGSGLTNKEDVVVSRRRQHAEKTTKLVAINCKSKMVTQHAKIACMIVDLANRSALALYAMCPNSKRDKEYNAVVEVIRELSEVEEDRDGKVLKGRRLPVFSQAEVYSAVGRVERMQWDYLDGLLNELEHEGLITYQGAPEGAAVEKQFESGVGVHVRDATDLIRWRGTRPVIVVS